jgi:Domain of unknown function (DUF4386)
MWATRPYRDFQYPDSGGEPFWRYEVMEWITGASSGPRPRITGVVYLPGFLTATSGGVLCSQKLIVYGDIVLLIAALCNVVLTLLLYEMFKPVNKNLSSLAAFFGLLGCIFTVLSIFHLVSTRLLMTFFGPYCLLIGYLVFMSIFLPRILGVLMMFAGLGWLLFLSPTLARQLSLYIQDFGILAEGLLMLWLLVKGVDVPRWKEQARVGG